MAIATTTALVAGSIALQAGSAYTASKANKANAAYSRDMAKNNAEIARQNAEDVEKRGRVAVFDQRRAVANSVSNVRSASAGAGLEVDVAGTTPQELVNSMVMAGEMDVVRLRNNIEREKRRAEVQGAQFTAQAGQFELQRRSINPFRSAATSAAAGITGGNNMDILGF